MKDIAKNFENSNINYQSYRLNVDTRLLYLINKSNLDRVCILEILKSKMLEFAHDNYAHEDHHRTLDRLKTTCYFFKMKSKIHAYIDDCSIYQLSKSSRKLSYEQLNLVETIAISLSQLSMNFIVALSIIT